MTRKPVDWEAIEREYRAGQLSVSEIARQHGISHTAIQKRAKAKAWTRNLAKQVRDEVTARLVADAVAATNAHETIDHAAARGVEVVRQHRQDIGRLRRIAARLGERLEAHVFQDAQDPTGDKESLADLLEKLSRVSTRVVQLERQAFNLDEPDGDGSGVTIVISAEDAAL